MTPPPYQIAVDGSAKGLFRVHSLSGREALSEVYSFDVVVTAVAGEDIERAALGKGTTDGEGMVTIRVPVHVREVQVVFPKRNIAYPVRVGDMDPIDEATGVRKRLEHLGFQGPPSHTETETDRRDRQAIASFQHSLGMEPTGELDENTRAALLREQGS